MIDFKVVPLNKKALSPRVLKNSYVKLYEKFGRDYIRLVIFLDGKMIIHDNKYFDRNIDPRKDIFAADPLKRKAIEQALKVLKDSSIVIPESFNWKDQDVLIFIATTIHDIVYKVAKKRGISFSKAKRALKITHAL